MGKKHTYHREKCTSCIREVTEYFGMQVILTGQHAFEWSISIVTSDSVTTIRFKNREKARQEFKKYKQKSK